MPFINHTHKFAFLGNARCASTSMYRKISEISKGDDIFWHDGIAAKPEYYHMGANELLERYPYTASYYKFCFIRNPWDRFVSSYREFKMDRHSEWNCEMKKFKDFKDFCLRFQESSLSLDIHFVPLYDQIYSSDGIQIVDHIARFENINQDYKNIMSKFGKPGKLNFHERNHEEKKRYTEFYTNETRDIIGEFYNKDIAAFNYSFEGRELEH